MERGAGSEGVDGTVLNGHGSSQAAGNKPYLVWILVVDGAAFFMSERMLNQV